VKYQLLGKSGLRVSELCLGAMTFGEEWGWGASKEECHKIFNAYVDAGGNFIDTANKYTEGTSEKYIGEFIASDRDRFVLATKYTSNTRRGDPNAGGNHRKNMIQSLDTSQEIKHRLHRSVLGSCMGSSNSNRRDDACLR
jgi:aryl-alcohol dehydrogenase-like predicted oxidoreductase